MQLRGLVTADVDGRAVNDIVHLIAELLENATTFSSLDTEVIVTCRLLSGGGAKVEIQDNGIGMSTEDLVEANERLLNPPVVDVAVARRMGCSSSVGSPVATTSASSSAAHRPTASPQ